METTNEALYNERSFRNTVTEKGMDSCHTEIANIKRLNLCEHSESVLSKQLFVHRNRTKIRKCPWFLLSVSCWYKTITLVAGGKERNVPLVSVNSSTLTKSQILLLNQYPAPWLKRVASHHHFVWLMISIKVISPQNEKVTNQIAVTPSHYYCLGMCLIDCLSIPA